MTERAPGDDTRAQDRDVETLDAAHVARPASAHGHPGSIALPEEPPGPHQPEMAMTSQHPEDLAGATPSDDELLAQQAGVEPKARSQWAYARIRFFRHR